jgi:hypothetical protein
VEDSSGQAMAWLLSAHVRLGASTEQGACAMQSAVAGGAVHSAVVPAYRAADLRW